LCMPPLSLSYHTSLPALPRRPLLSPLFPYTTLFRSFISSLPLLFTDSITDKCPRNVTAEHFISCQRTLSHFNTIHYIFLPQKLQDRKSTRLNSSHVSISYAVLCLTKKKTHTHSKSHM